jgi:lysozyme
MDQARTLHLLETEEGFKASPYRCPKGKRTIGIGYNLDARGNPAWWDGKTPWTHDQALAQLRQDVADIEAEMDRRWPKWRELSDARQAVCISAIFQLGIAGASSFKATIAALKARDFELAAHRMGVSLWHEQTTARVERAMTMMRTGEWL